MFHIKWWVFVAIKTFCFHMYDTFECHFKPNQKSQSDMTDPVVLVKISTLYQYRHTFNTAQQAAEFPTNAELKKRKMLLIITRKNPLRGFCLAPPGGARDNALREYQFVGTLTNNKAGMAGYGIQVTGYIRTDVWTERLVS